MKFPLNSTSFPTNITFATFLFGSSSRVSRCSNCSQAPSSNNLLSFGSFLSMFSHSSRNSQLITISSVVHTRIVFLSMHPCVFFPPFPLKVIDLFSSSLMSKGICGVKGGTYCTWVVGFHFSIPLFPYLFILGGWLFNYQPSFINWFFLLNSKKKENVDYSQNSSIRWLGII